MITVSVITWDASFREYFHIVDSFGKMDYPKSHYEFIWVDFYRNENPKLLEKISGYSNARVLNLNNDSSSKWHLGQCINAGITEARGNIIVIPDGDIIAPPNILSTIDKEHERSDDLVLYFRRFDEPADRHDPQKSYDLFYLMDACVLTNPTNYGGLISIRKNNMLQVNNYEEDDVFSGPGINAMELYVRLRNRGLKIQWHDEKIYHPYHQSTGFSPPDKNLMNMLAPQYPWIMPYAGIKQSWVLHSRQQDLSYMANDGSVNRYLSRMPISLLQLKETL